MWVFRFDLCGHQHFQSLLVSLALLLHCLGSSLGGCALSEPRQALIWSQGQWLSCRRGRERSYFAPRSLCSSTNMGSQSKQVVSGQLGGGGKSCCCSVSWSVFRKCSSCLSRGWMFVLHAGMKYSLRDIIFRACVCRRCECCSNTSRQYHFSASPLTSISVPSEEINVVNCPSCIFMPEYNDVRQDELGITISRCDRNRQTDFDIISLTMTLPT